MKKITLQSLSLRNYKGVQDLTVNFGDVTGIYGANESGKSTICAAFYWLLTGKDEFDRKDFEIKNTQNRKLNHLPHEVEAVIDLEVGALSYRYTLKRVYLERWEKTRGESKKEFKGHKTEYYIDGVLCGTEKEYMSKVCELIPLEVIKLVTNPAYFNSLKPEDQRRGLLSIVGEISNDKILDAIATPKNDFGALINALNSGKDLEQYKKELAAKRLTLKKEAIEFPARIEEAQRNIPERQDWAKIEQNVSEIKADYEKIDEIISDANKARQEKEKGITALRNQVFAKESKISEIRNRIKTELREKQGYGQSEIESRKRQITSLENDAARITKEIEQSEKLIDQLESDINNFNTSIESHRDKWLAINAEKLIFDEETCTCPTCKQSLPEGQIEQKKAELLKNFNEDVAKRKENEVLQSNRVKEQKAKAEQAINDTTEKLPIRQDDLKKITAEISQLKLNLTELLEAQSNKKAIDVESATTVLLEKNGDAMNLQDEITDLQKQIKEQTEALGQDSDHSAEMARKTELLNEMEDLNKSLGLKVEIEKMQKRIEQLQQDEQLNAQAIADIERQEFEIETFNKTKMDILEERVNSMFKYVKFRLFERQVNGSEVVTCVCEYNDTPYQTLNTAGKMLAGIDVLNTLSRHYGVHAPVFIDNRESITWVPETESQIISLIVSPSDEVLRLETVGEKKTKVA